MDLADIGFRVDTSGISRGVDSLDKMERKGAATTGALTKGFGLLTGAIAAAAAAYQSFSKLIDVARQFDVLNAQLITATGSAQSAGAAFAGLQEFAATTPYSLDQAVDGFTKLVNLGLTPSEKALTSYGNTAAAMGKDLSQMIEAVADASTGEFERLKEFGIKANKEGDRVKMTFQGVTTSIGNSAGEIEGYLMALGENEFAGAMEERAKTLDGAISNLGDTWDGLFLSVSNSGVGELIADGVRMASDAIGKLSDFIASGEAVESVKIWLSGWSLAFDSIEKDLEWTGEFLREELRGWGITGESTSKFMSDAFWNFPANLALIIQVSTVQVASFVDKVVAKYQQLDKLLNPANWNSQAISNINAAYETQVKLIEQVKRSEIDRHAATYVAAIASTDAQRKALEDLKKAHEERKAEQKAAHEAWLADYTAKLTATREAEAASKAADAAKLVAVKQLTEAEKQAAKDRANAEKAAAKEAQKAWDAYHKGLEDQRAAYDSIIAKVDDFGGAWSRSGSAMVDAFGDMAGALDDYSSKMENISRLQQELTFQRLQYADGTAEATRLDAGLAKLQEEAAKTQLGAISGVLGASSKLFKEQSKGRKMLHSMEMAFSAAEIAIAAQRAITNAVASIAAQGSTPVTGFAQVAAMSALMAGVLGAAGIAFSGGGGGGYTPPKAGTGTTLGDPSAQSASIAAAQKEFQDIQIDQLAELRGIRSSMQQLSGGIKQLALSLVRGVNFNQSLDDSQFGTKYTSVQDSIYAWEAKIPVIGGVIAKLDKLLTGSVLKVVEKIPVVGDIVGGVLGGFSSTSKKLVDSGIFFANQTFAQIKDMDGIVVDMYQTIRTTKKKAWGLSKKSSTKTKYLDIDASFSEQIANIFGYLGDSVLKATEQLGFGDLSAQLNAMVLSIGKVSFKGKKGEEIQKELEALIGGQADLMVAHLVPAMKQFQQMGEGLFETLMRVTKEQAVFNDAIGRIGIDLSHLSNVMQLEVGQSIIELMGGLDKFSSATGAYFDKFFSDSEKLGHLERSLSELMAELELPMVRTHAEFRKLVEGLDLTTEAGQGLFATLMEAAPSFDEYIERLGKLTEAERKAREKAVDLEKQAAQARLDVAREAYEAETARIQGLRDALNAEYALRKEAVSGAEGALRKAYDAEVNAINDRRNAQIAAIQAAADARIAALNEEKSVLQTLFNEMTSLADRFKQVAEPDTTGSGVGVVEALAAARRGNFSKAMDLQVGEVSSDSFGSATERAIAAAVQAGRLQQISDLAQKEADKAEKKMSDIDRQISSVERTTKWQIDAANRNADRQVDKLTEQLNTLLGIDDTTLSFADAMKKYQEAKKHLDELAYDDEMAKLDLLQKSADDVYKLHQEAYDAEIVRLDQILMDNEAHLNALLGIDTSVGSVAESVAALGAAIAAATASKAENDALRAELARLREEMASANLSIAKSAATTAAVLQRIELDGLDTRTVQ